MIGIISWLPNTGEYRARLDRLMRLLNRLQELWPSVPVTVLAQNWNKADLQNIKLSYPQLTIYSTVERLGILRARKTLRKYLLQSNADYFMLFDDDAIIEDEAKGHDEILKLMDEHPNGWAFSTHFVNGTGPAKYNPFAHSQLNLCCLSRYIFEQEDFPDIDPEKGEGFEDRIFSITLLCKYPELRWNIPDCIYCTHFKNKAEKAGSTWSRRKKYDWNKMRDNTEKIEEELIKKYRKD